jgi:translation elongation factor EF-Tu-like GTPase
MRGAFVFYIMNVEQPDLIEVRASIKLLSANKGGRQTAIQSGYRPDHVFEYKDGKILQAYMGDIRLDDGQVLHPGEHGEVTVRFLFREVLVALLKPGRKWWIHEGSKMIGEAEVIEVLNS